VSPGLSLHADIPPLAGLYTYLYTAPIPDKNPAWFDANRLEAHAEEREMTVRIRRSTGNVFSDLGFGEDEAENLKIRADLMIELTRLIEAQGLTQVAAAELLGVTQPRVSDLMRGKIDRFSVDSLIEMLGHAGACVSVVVTQRSQVV
jgi:predicted XRE-type DNA-binding protein